jgi:hypothetical protein
VLRDHITRLHCWTVRATSASVRFQSVRNRSVKGLAVSITSWLTRVFVFSYKLFPGRIRSHIPYAHKWRRCH